jgi:hypothetical protein
MTHEEIVQQRSGVYGPPHANMAGTSQQIAGLLTQMYANGGMTIDASGQVSLANWAAPLIMAAVKLNRAASGVHHEDSLTDAVNYWRFVLEMQGGNDERSIGRGPSPQVEGNHQGP